MSLDLKDCSFAGPAMPEPFVKYRLEELLSKKKLLAKNTGAEAKALQERWEVYRRRLRSLGEQGLALRVFNQVIEPLTPMLGWDSIQRHETVQTREGEEDGGYVFSNADGKTSLRAWVLPIGTDFDAPNKRGRAYRFSPALVAQRVLLAQVERVGLLTDGIELRIVLSDPSGRDSHIGIRLDRSGGWRSAGALPDSFRLLKALCQPLGVAAITELAQEARLSQSGVTKKLREQARRAVEQFIQGVFDDEKNREARAAWTDQEAIAKELWREGLILVYRILFILKLETSADPTKGFSFATTSLWRNSYSPSTALAPVVEKVKSGGVQTGGFLAESLRSVFRLFTDGLKSNEMHASPIGGMLFGKEAMPILESLHWSEGAVAALLDALLWTPIEKRGKSGDDGGRERVHYGALDVEDLGRVYEALLELEPGIATEPMCRLRRAKLEVVVPVAQGAMYRANRNGESESDDNSTDEDDDSDGEEPTGRGKTKVLFIEEIPIGRFYLRVGLGRKSSGSYYTPHPFVRFLVQETLGPQIKERSPQENPNPLAILALKVLDPAMGSGHFLVEACRFLADALYEACRLCDERGFWERVEALPDPNDDLLAYLPSRAPGGDESGSSQRKALALCRRLVAVHCLYGVDKNPLAVELARVSLWLESYAEGLPLTFLDHRLTCGDSLTGPFFEHLLTYPGSGERMDDLFTRGISERLKGVLADALAHVRDLDASIGKDVADIELKKAAKLRLDTALAPLKTLAAAWSGGVMLGEEADDAGYENLVRTIADRGDTERIGRPGLERMIEVGRSGISYDLVFPEVFHPDGGTGRTGGFHAVLGNPPWDRMLPADKEFFSAFDLRVLNAPTKREREESVRKLKTQPDVVERYRHYLLGFRSLEAIVTRLYSFQDVEVDGESTVGKPDAYRLFLERAVGLIGVDEGRIGLLVPSGFHANEGATGVRRLYLQELALRSCFSFENRKKLFEIDSRFKFATVIAERDGKGTSEVACAFYLQDMEWLASRSGALKYDLKFISETGGAYQTLIELRGSRDLDVAHACFRSGFAFGRMAEQFGVRLSRELNMTDDAFRFTPTRVEDGDPRDPDVAEQLIGKGFLPLHEGKTFHQFDDHWGEPPRYAIALAAVNDKPNWTGPARFYRVAFRDIASSTNERTAIFCLLPPAVLFGNKAPCEREPGRRPNAKALWVAWVANSYSFDFILRTKVQATVNLFILNGCPVPRLNLVQETFLAHSALRLSCNHEGYSFLWREQLGSLWREASPKASWPVLHGDDSRWSLRAATDAVIANAYGLDRGKYEHVLSSFSHKSYPRAPELCLRAFEELGTIGLEAFAKKHDPYWDIPLVTTLPKPVIDLPHREPSGDDCLPGLEGAGMGGSKR